MRTNPNFLHDLQKANARQDMKGYEIESKKYLDVFL